MPHQLTRFLTPPIIVGTVAAVCALLVGGFYIITNQRPSGSYVFPTSGPLTEEVDTTGNVKAAEAVDLAFQVGGRISYAGPAVGKHVAQGATLATLSSADLAASLEQAKAALQVQEANLASLQAGARPEDVAVSQTAVSGAQTALLQSKQSLLQAAQDAYEKSDDAIHNKVDQFISNPRSQSPTLLLTLSNSQLQSSIIAGRISMESLLSTWQQYLAALPTDTDQIDTKNLSATSIANLNQVSTYLDSIATGLTSAIPTTSYPASAILTYETNITSARAAISADVSAVNAAATGVSAAQSALASTQSQLTLKQAPPTSNALQAQVAQVAVAQAAVDSAAAQLGKSVISAPISGTITVNNVNAGEIASPGSPVISMISDAQFEFETYVSEADVAKVHVEQSSQVELDAYESQTPLSAHVIAVDPAATVQNGVSSYKVTLQFDAVDPRIQSGLTGSVKIATASVAQALSVPTSAIITKGTQQFVIVKSSHGDAQVPVQTGISSAGGMTQILSGVTSVDQIRTFGTVQQ